MAKARRLPTKRHPRSLRISERVILSPDDRHHLAQNILSIRDGADEIITELERAATEFCALRRLSVSPAVSREHITRIAAGAKSLRGHLQALDGRARDYVTGALLLQGLPHDSIRHLERLLLRLFCAASATRNEIGDGPGRPTDHRRNDLARLTVEVLKRHRVAVTANREGTFSQVLEVVFGAVGLTWPADPVDLLRRAVRKP